MSPRLALSCSVFGPLYSQLSSNKTLSLASGPGPLTWRSRFSVSDTPPDLSTAPPSPRPGTWRVPLILHFSCWQDENLDLSRRLGENKILCDVLRREKEQRERENDVSVWRRREPAPGVTGSRVKGREQSGNGPHCLSCAEAFLSHAWPRVAPDLGSAVRFWAGDACRAAVLAGGPSLQHDLPLSSAAKPGAEVCPGPVPDLW